MEEILNKEIVEFIGIAIYQEDGTYIWANKTDGTREILAVIKGYNTDIEKNEGKEKAEFFQNGLGNFIAEAINEKIFRELHREYKFIDYDLSVRLLNCLKSLDLNYPIELKDWEKDSFKRFRNFGKKSQDELYKFMNEYGYKFYGE